MAGIEPNQLLNYLRKLVELTPDHPQVNELMSVIDEAEQILALYDRGEIDSQSLQIEGCILSQAITIINANELLKELKKLRTPLPF